MFTKSNLLATLATGIFLFFGGYLIWGVLTVDFFAQHAGSATGVMKDPMNLTYIALGCFVEAFFLSTIYSKWARDTHSAKQGFELGAMVGAFIGLGMGLLWYGTTNFSDLTGVFAEAILDIIFIGIAGVIIALVYKSTTSK
ncbi:hypothetical protein [Lutibacter sp.]|uniref:hypothetical protein n=1 Tax=Lutibacter sp. TaxID=1925666 RepID=UPI0027360925|nr:hypothetical protein [Lutibacter sp.]MDP3313400.1 hypothetical protein [Lutibacter sp.]